MFRDLKLEKQIDAYVKGKLSEYEAQLLWHKLLKRPKYIQLLETEMKLKYILKSTNSSNSQET